MSGIPCPCCQNRRYVHIDYDSTGAPEIERCDMCCYPELTDEDAAVLHRLFCGCQIPEISEGRVGQETQGRSTMPFATFDMVPIVMAKLLKFGLDVNTTKEEGL